MTNPKITKIELWDFSPTFRDGPYVMSHVSQYNAYGRILRVHTTEGISGVGEIVFAPSLADEQRELLISSEHEYLGTLIGQPVQALDELCQRLRERGRLGCGVAFGLETALLDIKAQQQNLSLTDLLGGALNESVDDYFSISERSIQSIRDRVAIAGAHRAVIQLKLGIGNQDEDIEQITATLDAMNAKQLLLADANGGWSIEKACEIINKFDDNRIMWEEPCNSYDENAEVAQKVIQPIMLDQCIANPALAKKAVIDGLVAAVCIKPAFLGGLMAAREIRDLCADNQTKMRIDGPWCGDIATAAILHLAIGAPSNLLIAGCDLREPLVLKPCLQGVTAVGTTRIAPPTGLGLGVEANDDRLGEPLAKYE